MVVSQASISHPILAYLIVAAVQSEVARDGACNRPQPRALLRSLPPVAALPTPMSQLSRSARGSGRLCR